MCMFCAAIPMTAATGLSMDSKQRKSLQQKGRPAPRVRPFPLITVAAILLLSVGSVFYHLKFPGYW
jgi:hypothetical protein